MSSAVRSTALLVTMLATAAAAWIFRPQEEITARAVELGILLPRSFGQWREETNPVEQVSLALVTPNDPTHGDRPAYDQMLMRTYRDSSGARIMLALAYGHRQLQELKIHRPELCYYAQGFSIRDLGSRSVKLPDDLIIPARSLLTQSSNRKEPVSYWIRIGRAIPQSSWQVRWTIFRYGLSGRIPDGILVRTSSLIDDDSQLENALQLQRRFIADLYGSMNPQGRHLFAGM